MGLLNNTSDKDLIKGLMPEVAKAKHELKCAQDSISNLRKDVSKAESRLSYLIVLVNELLDRNNTD